LVCCGQPMKLYEANTVDAATEKHVPVLEAGEDGYKVTVGSVAHPMTDESGSKWSWATRRTARLLGFGEAEAKGLASKEHTKWKRLWR